MRNLRGCIVLTLFSGAEVGFSDRCSSFPGLCSLTSPPTRISRNTSRSFFAHSRGANTILSPSGLRSAPSTCTSLPTLSPSCTPILCLFIAHTIFTLSATPTNSVHRIVVRKLRDSVLSIITQSRPGISCSTPAASSLAARRILLR